MKRKIIIGTRGSELALWQANYTKNLLEEKGNEVEIKIIATAGDHSQQYDTSFDKLEGKGFFTKELEEALLKKEIDLAVHSHKDLPTESPNGLMIAGVSKREDPSDILIINDKAADDKLKFGLKKNAIVGTSSARRKSQLLAFRPDIQVKDLRGNVPTRINKLREGNYDAILIATAGVERLEIELDEFTVEKLNPEEFVPAPAQGVLAWQTREDDNSLLEIIDTISDLDVLIKINIERQLLNMFDGGCHLPFGAYCDTEMDDEDRLRFKVWISIAKEWNEQPKQLYFDTLDTDGFVDRMYEHIRAVKPKKIFITKTFKEGEYLQTALTKLGFEILGKSLIEFKKVTIKFLPKTDWIFFSSKHAVRFFFNQKPELWPGVKYGCVGSSTSAELRSFGYRADFIGQSTDIKLVGKQFSSKVGNARVLFPIARGSMQSIQWQMVKRDNVVNLEVYATIKHSEEISPENEIVIFTSPSNVESYFEKNTIHPQQKIIAMGEATGKALEKLKHKKYTMPRSFDDLGMIQAILGLPNN
ncbi:MAG: hydroxymethylbilane synthase [Bacteroidetes bacterium]|nr:hydroxymethylbilane synthase [Bacteroidota bacterium]